MKKLMAPFDYLRIFHREKCVFDMVLPLLFTFILSWVNNKLPSPITLLGEKGIVPLINGILQILVGFYIAALAAISTASLPRLDQKMAGNSPIFLGKKKKEITRRLFLTHLFGYLAFSSLLLYLAGGIAQISLANITHFISSYEMTWIKSFAKFAYLFMALNIFFVTMLGLFFLIEDNINKPTR